MSLLAIEGFETLVSAAGTNLQTALDRKYPASPRSTGSGLITSRTGRALGYSCEFAEGTTRANVTIGPFTAVATLIVGFAFKAPLTQSSDDDVVRLYDGATVHLTLRVQSDGSIRVLRNTTALATSVPGVIRKNEWFYIEFKGTISDTGSFEVRVDGINVVSLASADTRNGGNATVDRVNFGGTVTNAGTNSVTIDDIYIINTSGGVNDTFLSDRVVEGLFPDADTATSDWTPSTGTDNYALVDEAVVNDDTDYVSTNTIGHKDLYTVSNLATLDGDIVGVQINADVRVESGTNDVELILKRASTETAFSNQTLASTSYLTLMNVAETNPSGSATWTVADVNAVQTGVELKA